MEDYFSKVIIEPVSLGKWGVILPASSFRRLLLPLDKNQLLSQGAGTFIFCFTLTFHHIWDKQRVGVKITFSNHLLLIIEYRLISSFKGDDMTPRGSLILEKASAKSWIVKVCISTHVWAESKKENVGGSNSKQLMCSSENFRHKA